MADAMSLAVHLVLSPDYRHDDGLAWRHFRPSSLAQVAFEEVAFPSTTKVVVVAHIPSHHHLRRDALQKAEYKSDQA